MIVVERVHPFGVIHGYLTHGKIRKYKLEDAEDVLFVEPCTVYKRRRDIVFCFKLKRKRFGFGRIRMRAVYDDHERLAGFPELARDPLLGIDEIIPCNIAERSVRGDKYPDRRVIAYHTARSLLRRLFKRLRRLVPRGMHHADLSVLLRAERGRNKVPHAVYHLHFQRSARRQHHRRRLIRNELRLCGHDRTPARGLRKLVAELSPLILALHPREHRAFDKSFDKRALTRTHGARHTYHKLAVCPVGDIVIYASACHQNPPCTLAFTRRATYRRRLYSVH